MIRMRGRNLVTGLGYWKNGAGTWTKRLNDDITLRIEMDIVNNQSDRFIGVQVSVLSSYLQSLQDPANTLGISIPYACISVPDYCGLAHRLPYPETEVEASKVLATIESAVPKIEQQFLGISSGGALLSFLDEHPRFSMVGQNVLDYVRDLDRGKITHSQFPNWKSYSEFRSSAKESLS